MSLLVGLVLCMERGGWEGKRSPRKPREAFWKRWELSCAFGRREKKKKDNPSILVCETQLKLMCKIQMTREFCGRWCVLSYLSKPKWSIHVSSASE